MDQPLLHHPPAARALPRPPEPPPAYFAVKRVVDIAVSLCLLVLCAPVILAASLLVRLSSPGPALFRRRVLARQTWTGGSLQTFDAFKLRTMVDGAEQILAQDPALMEQYEKDWKLPADPRITRLGVWLRATSLDEMPQLVNVLRGEMTLVGPRIITPPELERYGPDAALLLSVKPGLTGLWQVSGRQKLSYAERVRLDMRYVQTRTLGQDMGILLRTVGCVLGRRGAY